MGTLGQTRTRALICAAAAAAAVALLPPAAAAEDAAIGRFRGAAAAASMPLDSVSELSRQGRHYEAVQRFLEQPAETTLSAKLAAAKSAWALGLVQLARTLWDESLQEREFSGVERARTMLARSIMELQESNLDQARALAERGAAPLEASALRSQFWLVIAETLKSQKALSLAEDYYQRAVNEAGEASQAEARYLLGECQLTLGKVNEARYTFVGVETGSTYTAQALRRLAEIDLEQKNYEGVLTWLEEARESYASDFSDGWSTYAYVTALLELGRSETAERELSKYKVQHSAKDSWFTLAEAAFEGKRATELFPALTKKEPESK